MKITYKPNPLATTVELDEHEKEVFRLKLKLEELEDRILGAQYHLGMNPYAKDKFDLDEAKRELDYDDEKLDARVDGLLKHYLEELQLEHLGDCVCFAMSCSKCHAESVLGINTLKPFPGKHEMYKIAAAFSRYNPQTQKYDGPEVTLDEAIQKLRNFKPNATWAGWEAHADRWVHENAAALEYLLNYRDTHFPEA